MRMRTPLPDVLENRDALVMSHVGLVKALANRLAGRIPPQVEVSELIGVGVLGLIDAAGRYRPALGVPFDAFARRRIHGAMLDALREMDWAPRSLRKLRRDVDDAMAKLRHALGREPEAEEIAEALKVSPEQHDKMLDGLRATEVAAIRQADPNDSRPAARHRRRSRRGRSARPARNGVSWPDLLVPRTGRIARARAPDSVPLLRTGTHAGRDRRGHRRERIARLAAAHAIHRAPALADARVSQAASRGRVMTRILTPAEIESPS